MGCGGSSADSAGAPTTDVAPQDVVVGRVGALGGESVSPSKTVGSESVASTICPPCSPSGDTSYASLKRYSSLLDRQCETGCGRPAYGNFKTCCTGCPTGTHSDDCESKLKCAEGCGRWKNRGEDGKQFKTCCRSCPHLKKERGFSGHDLECDVRDNGGTCAPWYWRSKGDGDFHEEVGGDYVRKMGTKLLQQTLPDHQVLKCFRVEDSALWKKYTTKRAEIRQRAVAVEDVKPETSENIEFSARTTLDTHVNEYWLFHGTSEEAAKGIARSNFRIPDHGGCFGKGAYFAEASVKSDQYAKRCSSVEGGGKRELGEDGCKVMLLCRVTLGNMKKLTGTDRKAEELVKDPMIDSVLGKTNHREFIVYDVAQAYPEYIMYYKKIEEPAPTGDS